MDRRKKQRLRNMKWGRILVTYFVKLLEKNEANKVMLSIVNRESDIVDNLIKELEKPFTRLSMNHPIDPQKGCRKRFSVIRIHEDNLTKTETRNINMIMTYLEHMSGFMEYCKFNHIYEDVLQTVCPFIKCEKIKKGEYLFKFGEPSKDFYTLLKGKISIRVPRNPYSNHQPHSLASGSDLVNTIKKENLYNPKLTRTTLINKPENKNSKSDLNKSVKNHHENADYHLKNLHNNATKKLSMYQTFFKLGEYLVKKYFTNKEKEIEQYIVEEGKCFGDFGIIHGINRTASAFALEDCVLMSINKELYEDYILKWAVKSENERKSFFKLKLNIFKESSRFNEYYMRTTLICPAKNQNVYIEGASSTCIYLIYHGEYMLEKSNLEIIEANDNSKHYKKVDKPLSLMRLVQGAFGGLEILYKKESTYDYSLKAIGNYNVVFQIDLDHFQEFSSQIKEFLHNLYDHQNKILKSLIEKKLSIKNFKNSIFENTKYKTSTTEQKIQDYYNEFRNTSTKPKTEVLTHNVQIKKNYLDYKDREKRIFSSCASRETNRIDADSNLAYNGFRLIESNSNLSVIGCLNNNNINNNFNHKNNLSNNLSNAGIYSTSSSNGNNLKGFDFSDTKSFHVLESNCNSEKTRSNFFQTEKKNYLSNQSISNNNLNNNNNNDNNQICKDNIKYEKALTPFSSEEKELRNNKTNNEDEAKLNKTNNIKEQKGNMIKKTNKKLKSNLIIHNIHETNISHNNIYSTSITTTTKSVDQKSNLNNESNLNNNFNFSSNIFKQINNSPERNLATNLNNFMNINPQNKNNINHNYKLNFTNNNNNNNNTNNTSNSKNNCLSTTFYTDKGNKTSSNFFKSKNNLPIISVHQNDKDSPLDKKLLYKKNVNPIGIMYSNNVPNKFKKNSQLNFKSSDSVNEDGKKSSDENMSKNLSKYYKYETISSITNAKLKKSNLHKIELHKYNHLNQKNELLSDVNDKKIKVFNKSADGKKIVSESFFEHNNKRHSKALSIDINDNKNGNFSSDPIIRTPIRLCIDKWNDMKAKQSTKKNKFNLYRTSYFNIPLISMISGKK